VHADLLTNAAQPFNLSDVITTRAQIYDPAAQRFMGRRQLRESARLLAGVYSEAAETAKAEVRKLF
jgi:hypothetical protein